MYIKYDIIYNLLSEHGMRKKEQKILKGKSVYFEYVSPGEGGGGRLQKHIHRCPNAVRAIIFFTVDPNLPREQILLWNGKC